MPRAYKNKWDKSWYNYYDLAHQTSAAELTKEFKRMKRESERRLQALSRSKNETAQALYREYKDIISVKPKSKRATAKAIIATEQFLSLKTSKVTNIYKAQRQTLESLHASGYDFVTKNNLKDFGRFMEAMRAAGYARKGSSGSVMEFLSERGKIGSNTEKLKEQYERWMDRNG